jgi:hypothetical protein
MQKGYLARFAYLAELLEDPVHRSERNIGVLPTHSSANILGSGDFLMRAARG